jgi:hypothetical protein
MLPMPQELLVRPAEETRVEVGVVPACRISGRISLPTGDDNGKVSTLPDGAVLLGTAGYAGGAGATPPPPPDPSAYFRNAIITISTQDEVYRGLVNQDGSFSFEGIRPGNWKLTVDADNLPSLHYLKQSRFRIDLAPGDAKNIEVEVAQRLRPIHMVEEGEIR